MNLDNAEVVIVGGGVSGLSSGWWLARAGVDVVVVDKGVIGYEASSRNGGQMGHRGKERADGLAKAEVELWPQLDDLLGYPTEWKPGLLRIALLEYEMEEMKQYVAAQNALGAEAHILDRETVLEWVLDGQRAGAGRTVRSQWRAREPAAHRAGVRMGDAGPWRADTTELHRYGIQDRRRADH